MFDPFTQSHPWTPGSFGAQPFGFGTPQGPYAAGMGGFGTQYQQPFGYQGAYPAGMGGFANQYQQPFGYSGPQGWPQSGLPSAAGWGGPPQLPPQTWLGFPQHVQHNPAAQQIAAQLIPQLILEAQRLAQQIPLLAQQIPQLIQQNPQLAQQAPQLQHVPFLLQQAAEICQRVPQVLQAAGVFGGSPYSSGVGGRPFNSV